MAFGGIRGQEQVQNELTQNPKQADIYDLHREALQAYHAACKECAAAQNRRAIAKEELEKVGKEFYEFLSINIQDPTAVNSAPTPGNGQAAGQLARSW